jgi:hypothetical protein
LTSFDPGYYFLQIKNDSMTDPKQEEERADWVPGMGSGTEISFFEWAPYTARQF